MEVEELRAFVGGELKRRFWEHKAMPALSRSRGRMDGWLKVLKGVVPLEQVLRETSA